MNMAQAKGDRSAQDNNSAVLAALEAAANGDGTLHDLALIRSSLLLTPSQRLERLVAYVRMVRSAFIVTEASDRSDER